MENRRARQKRFFYQILFILYLGILLYFLFFCETYRRSDIQDEYHYNLKLFAEINRVIQYREILGWKAVLINLVGNVLAFLPMGFMLPRIWQVWRRFYLVVIAAFGFSLFAEVVQLLTKVGTFDVDDLFLNSIGGLMGYLLFLCVKGNSKDSI